MKKMIRSALPLAGVCAVSLCTLVGVAARPQKGWVSLFDGKTLGGWERKAVHGGNGGLWEVRDRAIVGNQEPDHKGGLLGTTALYGDCEVEAEFKADNPVDTGLFLRTAPNGNGYQVTIDYRPGGTVGSLYVPADGFVAQDPDWPAKYKKDGWNTVKARIVGQPPRVTVWLNNKQTVDFTDTKERVAREGYIGLQVHGGAGAWGDDSRVRFRKVRVRPLRPAATR
jgi:hypothetical protein